MTNKKHQHNYRKPTKQQLRFARHLQNLRKKQGVTQEELAARLRVSTQWVSAIERGKRYPSLPLVYHIARILGVKVKDLFPF